MINLLFPLPESLCSAAPELSCHTARCKHCFLTFPQNFINLLNSTYSRCYTFAHKIQPISPYEQLHLHSGKRNRTSGASYYSKLKPLKYVAWPVLAYTTDPTRNHTIDLCYMATTLYTDSDVNTSKSFLPQEEDRFKQLWNKTQEENSFVIRDKDYSL